MRSSSARHVLAVELLCACQAIDLLAPLRTSAPLARVHARVRAVVPPLGEDRPPSPDIEAVAGLIASGAVDETCEVVRVVAGRWTRVAVGSPAGDFDVDNAGAAL